MARRVGSESAEKTASRFADRPACFRRESGNAEPRFDLGYRPERLGKSNTGSLDRSEEYFAFWLTVNGYLPQSHSAVSSLSITVPNLCGRSFLQSRAVVYTG